MTTFLLNAKAFLDAFDPRTWYIAVAGIVWLLIYLWRRISLATWDAVTKRSPALGQLPALVLGALLSAAPAIGKPLLQVVQETILGAVLAAIGATGIHVALRALPGPYNGARPPAPPGPPAPLKIV